jgi:hypothetical protein
METTKISEKLDLLPEETKSSLRNFLNDDNNCRVIKSQLKITPVIIDDGKFQISISSIEELNNIIKQLNESLTLNCC